MEGAHHHVQQPAGLRRNYPGYETISGTAGNWSVWDLTAYLQAEKAAGRNVVTLVIKNPSPSQNQAVFHSDEAGSNRPELVIA